MLEEEVRSKLREGANLSIPLSGKLSFIKPNVLIRLDGLGGILGLLKTPPLAYLFRKYNPRFSFERFKLKERGSRS